jgi:hypothetical protein
MHISFILSLVLSTDEDLFPTSVQEDEDPFFAPNGGLFSTSKRLFDHEEDVSFISETLSYHRLED